LLKIERSRFRVKRGTNISPAQGGQIRTNRWGNRNDDYRAYTQLLERDMAALNRVKVVGFPEVVNYDRFYIPKKRQRAGAT